MALGGGQFITQNKKLPGSYINFVSMAAATAAAPDRGVAALPLELDWGEDNAIFTVTSADFEKNSVAIFGYEAAHEKLRDVREAFLNAHTLLVYRLNGSDTGRPMPFARRSAAGRAAMRSRRRLRSTRTTRRNGT